MTVSTGTINDEESDEDHQTRGQTTRHARLERFQFDVALREPKSSYVVSGFCRTYADDRRSL